MHYTGQHTDKALAVRLLCAMSHLKLPYLIFVASPRARIQLQSTRSYLNNSVWGLNCSIWARNQQTYSNEVVSPHIRILLNCVLTHQKAACMRKCELTMLDWLQITPLFVKQSILQQVQGAAVLRRVSSIETSGSHLCNLSVFWRWCSSVGFIEKTLEHTWIFSWV